MSAANKNISKTNLNSRQDQQAKYSVNSNINDIKYKKQLYIHIQNTLWKSKAYLHVLYILVVEVGF